MDTQRAPTVQAAVRALAARDDDHASQRNDIGFNGADTEFGNSLATKRDEWWTPRMKAAAYRMLAKYAKQLGTLGIDYSAIPNPATEATPASAAPQSQYSNGQRSPFAPARGSGTCTVCGQRFSVGDPIGFKRTSDGRYDRFHDRCANAPDTTRAPATVSAPSMTRAPMKSSEPAPRSAPISQIDIAIIDITGPRVSDVLGPQGSIARSMGARYEHRPQQLVFSEKIEQAFAGSRMGDPVQGTENEYRHVVCEAGTGTGKSFAYIVPAALTRKKTIVSTAVKALQDQLLNKDLPFADAAIEGGVTYASLKGRSNYVCKYVHQQAKAELDSGSPLFVSAEGPQQFQAINEWIASGAAERVNGDLDQGPVTLNGDVREMLTTDSDNCLGKKCPLFGECYVERAKEAAANATVVVVNHALLLIDAKVKENSEGHASILPKSHALVIDEAHRLEEYATNALGEELSQGRWLRLERALERFTRKHREADPDAASEWMMLASEVGVPWFAFFETLKARMEERDTTQMLLGDERADAGQAIEALDQLATRMTRSGPPKWLDDAESERWPKLAASIEKVRDWLGIAVTPEDGAEEKFCRFAQIDGVGDRKRLVVNVKPIDVSDYLQQMVWRAYPSVTACSATLAVAGDFRPWRKRVGCTVPEQVVDEYVCESPFPYRENSVLYVPRDGDVPDPRAYDEDARRAYFEGLVNVQQQLIESGTTRVFLLFTSNRALRTSLGLLSERLGSEWDIYVQGEMPRQQIVDAFKSEGGHKVLFATRTFFEGIDLQGDALTMVVIDKLPFPSHEDPIIKKKSELVERRGGNSFGEIMLPEVVNTLKQGAGRLIRTSTDYGCVAILDSRLRGARYGATIMKALPPMRPTDSVEAVRQMYLAHS